MSRADRVHVLISEPQLNSLGMPCLPIVWGILKTYWDYNGVARDVVEWLPPVHEPASVASMLAPYGDTPIDVLGLSCYAWNWSTQIDLARAVKARSPRTLVVAGGPHPDHKDPEFFEKYPYIDIIAERDGEITFTKLLDAVVSLGGGAELLASPAELRRIGGLYLHRSRAGGLRVQQEGTSKHMFTGPAEVPKVFEKSPYIEQTAYYEELRSRLERNVFAIWETNRGCPYGCTFCDWGSNTLSKLRIFDPSRIEAEAEWFGKLQVGFVMLADANFGILKRDLDIVDFVERSNKKYGYPNYLSYNTAKNNPGRTVDIARKVINAGLGGFHILSIQHTDPDVLAIAKRANISTDKQLQVVRELMADEVAIFVQLILGMPGDTRARWQKCFGDLMEWGIHSDYHVFHYDLLPNAPIAEPESLETWQIETVQRHVILNPGMRRRDAVDEFAPTRSRLIVSTRSFSTEDWVRMNVHTAFVKALHNCCLTRSIAIYLRFTHGIRYVDFYDAVIEDFIRTSDVTRHLAAAVAGHFEDYLRDDDKFNFIDVAEWPDHPEHFEPSRWAAIQLCFIRDRFYDALAQFLAQRYPGIENIHDVVNYQRNIVILPDYDANTGKVFPTGHDWIAYFEEAARLVAAPEGGLPEPRPTPNTTVVAQDRTAGRPPATFSLAWSGATEEERWAEWVQRVLLGHNSVEKNNLRALSLRHEMSS